MMNIEQQSFEINNKNLVYLQCINFLKKKPLQSDVQQTLDNMHPSWTNFSEQNMFYCDKLVGVYRQQDKQFNCVKWFSNGQKLLTGLAHGELILVNLNNFEKDITTKSFKIQESHRSICLTKNEKIIIAGDKKGIIHFIDNQLQELNRINPLPQQADFQLREISVSPSDQKIISCTDDKDLYIWDIQTGQTEMCLSGHGNEVTSCDWHPTQCLVASSSKDQSIKLWDPRSGNEHATINKHKQNINKVRWNQNGNWVVSVSKDNTAKLIDIRKVENNLITWKKSGELNSVTWHPHQEKFLAIGDSQGEISYFSTEDSAPIFTVVKDNRQPVFDLAWNPLGHVMASLGNDKKVEFWAQNFDIQNVKTKVENNIYDPQQINRPFQNQLFKPI